MRSHAGSIFALSLAAGLAEPSAASAAVLQKVFADSFSGNNPLVSFSSFDPALGTLERVDIAIHGTITVQGPTAVRFIPSPQGPVFVPFGVSAVVHQDFVRIGIGDRGFEFSTPAHFALTGFADGTGEMVTLARPFSYQFAFTDFTDQLGFVVPLVTGGAPPATIVGTRDDFLDLAAPLPDLPIDLLMLTQTVAPIGFTSASGESIGTMIVTYTYEPAPVSPGGGSEVEVAEPGALALLAAGLFGLSLRPRRRFGM